MTENKFGLSKKTNIAIAGIAGISVVKDVLLAIGAVVLITLVAISYQFIIDRRTASGS
ncbi:MAG: hypothetical protein ACYS30_24615 [Planctomycetota bacterium]